MQDINKSEILEKMRRGWKVRCKAWDKEEYLRRDEPIEALLTYFGYDTWEGEPPDPVPYHQFLDVKQAFSSLKNHNGIKYLRRTKWKKDKVIKYCELASYSMLTAEDILAEDWETYK